MKKKFQHQGGFTLTEILIATLLMTFALVAVSTGFLYIFRGERLVSVQNKLDIDVRRSLERVRIDMRLSSMDHIFYFPAGPGPYTAVSMPLAHDDNGDGLIEMDTNNLIVWDQTVVYHIKTNTNPHELRRTVFDPRNNGLTAAQRQQQLGVVVSTGLGDSTWEGSGAKTTVIFSNLFEWAIWGKGAQFDAYARSLGRAMNVRFGSLYLTPGLHTFTFTSIGKNPASTSHKIGLDRLTMTASGIPREAETQTVSATMGATTGPMYMGGLGSWENNYQLYCNASSSNQGFTLAMNNDQWEETTFSEAGSEFQDTDGFFNESMVPKDFVLRVPVGLTNWSAEGQTMDTAPKSTSNQMLHGSVIRVAIRGANMPDGGDIRYRGPLHCIWYKAGSSSLKVNGGNIAEAASSFDYTPDTVPGTRIALTPSATIGSGAYGYLTMPADKQLYMDTKKTYLVTFDIENSGNSEAVSWTERHPPTTNVPPTAVPGCYIITLTNGANPMIDLSDDNWSSKTNMTVSDQLFAIEHVHCLAPSNGYYSSPTVDTHLDAPVYNTLTWSTVRPAGTQVKMKIRTGSQPDMSDAMSWSNAPAVIGVSYGLGGLATRRYVQVRAEMISTNIGANFYTPILREFMVKWNAEPKIVDLGADVTTGPDYGIFNVLVDGSNSPKKGITVDLTIYQYVRGFAPSPGVMLKSTVTAEVEPRNTGK